MNRHKPKHGATSWRDSAGRTLTLRESSARDAARLGRLFETGLSARSRRLRFHSTVGRLSPQRLAQLADADFVRRHSWLVTLSGATGEPAVAEARLVVSADGSAGEFALSVADDWQGQGLGRRLMQRLVEQARAHQLLVLQGSVMVGNAPMNALLRRFGLDLQVDAEDESQFVATLQLQPAPGVSAITTRPAWAAWAAGTAQVTHAAQAARTTHATHAALSAGAALARLAPYIARSVDTVLVLRLLLATSFMRQTRKEEST